MIEQLNPTDAIHGCMILCYTETQSTMCSTVKVHKLAISRLKRKCKQINFEQTNS